MSIHIIRWFFILLLAASSIAKLADMDGFARVVATYDVIPLTLTSLAAWSLTLFELFLAAWLATGRKSKGAALTLVGLHGLYFSWLAVALLRGLDIPNCGCFGVYFARPLSAYTLLEDLLLIGLASWLLVKSKHQS